ncbi:MAG: LysR substrate-binding domain-containing protein [Burkholderiaceae bacterium]
MTLTELKYIVAVARERHFGRAAEACFVSQPTLSVAIKKLEEELQIQIFERGGSEIGITPIGQSVVEQAQRVLEEASAIREIAQQGKDPLAGPLRVGVIYTIGPYLLPALIPRMIADAPSMPLILQEDFTVKLLELLRQGEIDVAILADPFSDAGLVTQPLYDEPFVVALPRAHKWATREQVSSLDIKEETMLLLGTGHCFRDHVLEVCPELSRFSQASAGIQKTFEGSSLETIRHMVASGIGITVLPSMAVPRAGLSADGLLRYVPFESPGPYRRVMLAWRKSFARLPAIEALRQAVLSLELAGVTMLPDAPARSRSAPQGGVDAVAL